MDNKYDTLDGFNNSNIDSGPWLLTWTNRNELQSLQIVFDSFTLNDPILGSRKLFSNEPNDFKVVTTRSTNISFSDLKKIEENYTKEIIISFKEV